jgi:hypothetical protein
MTQIYTREQIIARKIYGVSHFLHAAERMYGRWAFTRAAVRQYQGAKDDWANSWKSFRAIVSGIILHFDGEVVPGSLRYNLDEVFSRLMLIYIAKQCGLPDYKPEFKRREPGKSAPKPKRKVRKPRTCWDRLSGDFLRDEA